MDIRWRSHLEK